MRIRKFTLTLFFIVLTLLMLLYADPSLSYALKALNLWFQKMIPTLFPFMLLSGIMVRMNLTEDFASLVYPLVKYLFFLSKNCIYCIIMGFLCGFPMGAKVITDLYERGKLTRPEAEYLLFFCNNIGPIYFIGFVLPTIGISSAIPFYLFGMYGLPFLYGIFLRFTLYKNRIPLHKTQEQKMLPCSQIEPTDSSFLSHIDDAIGSALKSITALGGYMIFFNLLNLIPYVFFLKSDLLPKSTESLLLSCINGLLEITGGIHKLGTSFPLFVLILLPFGGFSCIAQTFSIIRHTDLSITSYIQHKLVLTTITACFYWFYFFYR